MIIDRPETIGRIPLVPVHIEGSTRRELWPEPMIRVLKTNQQLAAHGGLYRPPIGYPLNIRRTSHASRRSACR